MKQSRMSRQQTMAKIYSARPFVNNEQTLKRPKRIVMLATCNKKKYQTNKLAPTSTFYGKLKLASTSVESCCEEDASVNASTKMASTQDDDVISNNVLCKTMQSTANEFARSNEFDQHI